MSFGSGERNGFVEIEKKNHFTKKCVFLGGRGLCCSFPRSFPPANLLLCESNGSLWLLMLDLIVSLKSAGKDLHLLGSTLLDLQQ